MIVRILAIVFCVMIAGCEPPRRVTTYSTMPADRTMRVLQNRLRSIKNVSAQGTVTLQKPDGDSIQLDVAMVIDSSGDARLRAWKMGQAVLDLTLTPSGLWAVLPSQEPETSGENVARSMRQWLRILMGSIDDSAWTTNENDANLFLSQKLENGSTINCEVDRNTVTAKRYMLRDQTGKQMFSLALSNYAEFNGIAWPKHMEALSPTGTIKIDLQAVEINGDLSAKVFRPPTRAQKLPETSP
jgi:Domain of unknown function (DUF4292)